MSEEDAHEAARLGFDIAQTDRLRELFDHYDVDQSRALDANELECMLVELGHEADHTTARVLQDEFGDVPRSDEADGRAISFPAFMRLVAKVENKQAEFSRGEPTATRIMTALIRRFSLSTVAPAAELTRDGSTGEAGQGQVSELVWCGERRASLTHNFV